MPFRTPFEIVDEIQLEIDPPKALLAARASLPGLHDLPFL